MTQTKAFARTVMQRSQFRNFIKNFISMVALQGANYVLPLLMLPYLLRVLGIEFYGILGFATAIVTYLGIFVDYGFGLSAIRDASASSANRLKLIELFNSILVIKLILGLIGLLIITILVLSDEKYFVNWEIYYLSYAMIFAQILYPAWLFQGVGKARLVSNANLISKISTNILTYLFVKEHSDYLMVPLISAVGSILICLWGIRKACTDYNIGIHIPTRNTIKKYLFSGKLIYITTLCGNLYSQGNIVISGIYLPPLLTGYYSVSLKLTYVITGVYQIAGQLILPIFSNANNDKGKYLFKKVVLIVVFSNALITFVYFLFSEYIYIMISKVSDPISIEIFRFSIIISFFTNFNVVLTPIIIALKNDAFITKLYLGVGLSFVFLGSLLAKVHGINGILFSVAIIELTIFILSFVRLYQGFQK